MNLKTLRRIWENYKNETSYQNLCRMQTAPAQKQLLRIVKTPEGDIKLDLTGRANGRGAYICNKDQCVQTAVKRNSLIEILR